MLHLRREASISIICMGKITMTDILRVMRNSGRLFQQPPRRCGGRMHNGGDQQSGCHCQRAPVSLFLIERHAVILETLFRFREVKEKIFDFFSKTIEWLGWTEGLHILYRRKFYSC
jgi:hypothetical protein